MGVLLPDLVDLQVLPVVDVVEIVVAHEVQDAVGGEVPGPRHPHVAQQLGARASARGSARPGTARCSCRPASRGCSAGTIDVLERGRRSPRPPRSAWPTLMNSRWSVSRRRIRATVSPPGWRATGRARRRRCAGSARGARDLHQRRVRALEGLRRGSSTRSSLIQLWSETRISRSLRCSRGDLEDLVRELQPRSPQRHRRPGCCPRRARPPRRRRVPTDVAAAPSPPRRRSTQRWLSILREMRRKQGLVRVAAAGRGRRASSGARARARGAPPLPAKRPAAAGAGGLADALGDRVDQPALLLEEGPFVGRGQRLGVVDLDRADRLALHQMRRACTQGVSREARRAGTSGRRTDDPRLADVRVLPAGRERLDDPAEDLVEGPRRVARGSPRPGRGSSAPWPAPGARGASATESGSSVIGAWPPQSVPRAITPRPRPPVHPDQQRRGRAARGGRVRVSAAAGCASSQSQSMPACPPWRTREVAARRSSSRLWKKCDALAQLDVQPAARPRR